MRCAQCSNLKYCSRSYQRADWRKHVQDCKVDGSGRTLVENGVD